MEIGLVTLALAVGVMWMITVRARRVRQPHWPQPLPSNGDDVDPSDVADIDAIFQVVDADQARHRDELVVSRLRPLVDRRVPVRCIEAVPDLRGARVRFADGTAVVVRGSVPGDVGILASLVRDHSLLAGACSTDATGIHLEFGFSGGRRTYSVLVAGLDQPD